MKSSDKRPWQFKTRREKCAHMALHKFFSGPEYQCTDCGAMFQVQIVQPNKRRRG